MRQRSDDAEADRIADPGEDDRNGSARSEHFRHAERAADPDDVGRECRKLLGALPLEVAIVASPADLDAQVLAVAPAELSQALPDHREPRLPLRRVCSTVRRRDGSMSPATSGYSRSA